MTDNNSNIVSNIDNVSFYIDSGCTYLLIKNNNYFPAFRNLTKLAIANYNNFMHVLGDLKYLCVFDKYVECVVKMFSLH